MYDMNSWSQYLINFIFEIFKQFLIPLAVLLVANSGIIEKNTNNFVNMKNLRYMYLLVYMVYE